MEKIPIKTILASAILAGGIILGGSAINETEIEEARMSLLDKKEFTKNNPNLCNRGRQSDERCLDFQEFLLLVEEYDKVKNVDVGKEVKTFEEKLDDKLKNK